MKEHSLSGAGRMAALRSDDSSRTATVERVPDASAMNLDALFEAEWQNHLLALALERMKAKFSLKQIQIFDLHALQEWPAADVAKALGVSVANGLCDQASRLRGHEERIEALGTGAGRCDGSVATNV